MGLLAPAWDLHPTKSWGAASKWNAVNGICEREGDTPSCSLKSAMEPGRFTPARAGWTSVQFSQGSVSVLTGTGAEGVTWGGFGGSAWREFTEYSPWGLLLGQMFAAGGHCLRGCRVTSVGCRRVCRGSEGGVACRCMHEVGLG